MHKVDTKDMIFNQIKLPELFAQILSQKLDKPYEEIYALLENSFNKKIDEVEKNFSKIGQSKDINIDEPKDLKDFLGDNEVIKG